MPSRVVCISESAAELRVLEMDHELSYVEWPEGGAYGDSVSERIAALCRDIDVRSTDCVICENLSSAPFVFELRRQGYLGSVILIPHINPYPLRNLVHALLCSQVWGKDDVVVAGSPVTAERYERLFGMTSCAAPTYGVDQALFTPRDKAAARRKLQLPSGQIMLYTGRFAPDKNTGAVLLSYEELRQQFSELRLAMAISFKEMEYYGVFAEQLRNTTIFDRLKPHELPDLYSAADLFVTCATSYFETFGSSPLEAIACGTPVVVPDWDGFRSYVHDGAGTLVRVDFLDEPLYEQWSYAMVDLPAFVESCAERLSNRRQSAAIPGIDANLTRGAAEMELHRLVSRPRRDTALPGAQLRTYSTVVSKVLEELRVAEMTDLLTLATCADSELPDVSSNLYRELYAELFQRESDRTGLAV